MVLAYDQNLETAGTANAPASTEARIVSLDFIRGFAVLGILAANMVALALPNVEQSWPTAFEALSPASEAAWLTNFLLIDGKMRSLFAILFGASLALLIEKVDARDEFGLALQMRRLFWLALFGLAHFVLLFRGDILFAYALWGFFAMFMVRLQPALLFALGLALYLAVIPFDAMTYSPFLDGRIPTGGSAIPAALDSDALLQDGLRDQAAMAGGSLAEIAGYRLERHGFSFLSSALDALNDSFPMMLIGIALFRSGLFAWGAGSRKVLIAGAGLAVMGLVTGWWLSRAPLASGFALAETRYYTFALASLQRLPMSIGWLFVLVALTPTMAQGWLGERIVAAGRMAFSNYIGTSMVMGAIFQGWGLGLFGDFTRFELVPFVMLGWVLMLAWSKPWLAHFRYGPLEWLWRCLTEWRLIPMRR